MKNLDHRLDLLIYACIGISTLATFLLATAAIVYFIKAIS